ncbi:hypothetical protein [Nonlabens sp.]|uniref:hypothetical protein n=1 Tax=Nonlabens sp. TaxID=1888209 RepID=UPI003F69AD82
MNKITINFYLGLVFLILGAYKLFENYFLEEELPTYQLIGSFFLVGLGLFRVYQYLARPKSTK